MFRLSLYLRVAQTEEKTESGWREKKNKGRNKEASIIQQVNTEHSSLYLLSPETQTHLVRHKLEIFA